VGGDAEDPDPSGGVLDDGQDVGAGAIEQVDGEEVGGKNRLGLAVEELRPRWSCSSRSRWDPCLGEDLPYRRRRDADAESGEFAMDTPVTSA
jgi:hypothetical protein